jgi:hypothetical protein
MVDLAKEIEAGLREAIAHRRSEIALETRIVGPMPPKKALKTPD